jgi:hypothetical protein
VLAQHTQRMVHVQLLISRPAFAGPAAVSTALLQRHTFTRRICLTLFCALSPSTSPLPPGGYFDPLKLAGGDDPERAFRLKTAEIKHGRLAMVAFLGEWQLPGAWCCWHALLTA